jgi:hypothetical protein
MTATTDSPPGRTIISQRTWVSGDRRVEVDLDSDYRMCVVFHGQGSVEGAHAICRLVDEIRDEQGHDKVISALVDMRRIHSAPLRAQAIIGRWLLSRKQQIQRIAVFGGGRLEMAVARAVMTIAGMGQKAHFGGDLAGALAFLGFPPAFHR